MIADIFYPKFTITITNLVCFIQKKKVFWGFCTHHFTKTSPWASRRPPAATVFDFDKNQCAHIFSVLSPDILNKIC